jgi:hypothetical protein
MRAQLTGNQSISMTASGVSNTPLKATALAYNTAGCNGAGVYAKITEVITNANWYDNVVSLSLADDDFTLATGETQTLSVFAIPATGSAFVPPYADLTFSTSDGTKATVNGSGVVSRAANATNTIITATITNKNTISANASVDTIT